MTVIDEADTMMDSGNDVFLKDLLTAVKNKQIGALH
jgi:hypothetical protein